MTTVAGIYLMMKQVWLLVLGYVSGCLEHLKVEKKKDGKTNWIQLKMQTHCKRHLLP